MKKSNEKAMSGGDIVEILKTIIPAVANVFLTDRANEREHELALLERDREYAMAKLKAYGSGSSIPPEAFHAAVEAFVKHFQAEHATATAESESNGA